MPFLNPLDGFLCLLDEFNVKLTTRFFFTFTEESEENSTEEEEEDEEEDAEEGKEEGENKEADKENDPEAGPSTEDDGENAEKESIGSNEAGPSDAKESTDKVAQAQEEEEDPSNLQLAWEMLELAKVKSSFFIRSSRNARFARIPLEKL